MTDKREQIINRLHEIVGGIASFKTTERNRIEFDDSQLPAVSVLEGDEEVDDIEAQGRRPAGRPAIVVALPQVVIRVAATKGGADLNILRAAVIKAVMDDTTLNTLSMNASGVTYRGMQTTLHAGRFVEMPFAALMFGIRYVLQPSDL